MKGYWYFRINGKKKPVPIYPTIIIRIEGSVTKI